MCGRPAIGFNAAMRNLAILALSLSSFPLKIMTRSPSLCALSHSPVWFLDVEGPLRVEQRKELLLPVVLLCGEKDAAKVVAAKGKREKRGL